MTTESPEYLRTSLAAAMTLGLRPGLFYRNASLGCINLLLQYDSGCIANCAYCGLSRQRPGSYNSKSFIRVDWPLFELDVLIGKLQEKQDRLGRICISMITHPRAVRDTIIVTEKLITDVDLPISLLISPTVLKRDNLVSFKCAGADKIGIAVDAATPEIFARFRGSGVKGPHQWGRYWQCFDEAVDVFGTMNVGSHLIVGLGETEQEMVSAFRMTREHGGDTHLFSFYPESGSEMANYTQCPMDKYRRMQLARFLIDQGYVDDIEFSYNEDDQLVNFGVSRDILNRIITSGEPFMTSGCTGRNKEVACNRPYANSMPGPYIRNFPFKPEPDDIEKIKAELND